MLSLSQRTAKLGDKYAGKKRKDEDLRTLKVELSEIMLDRQELAAVLQEPHAFEALYNTSANPIEPLLACVKALEMRTAWEGANVVLYYELGKTQFEIKNAKLTRIRLEPRRGGETALSLTVEGDPALTKKLVDIIERVGTGIEVEIHAEHPAAQKELALNRAGTGEAPEHKRKGRARGRRNGHRPSAH